VKKRIEFRMLFNCTILYTYIFIITLFFTNYSFANPKEHIVNGEETGWCYPLDNTYSNNKSITPNKNISLGFMSYNSTSYPYHYAQDITIGYKEGSLVYTMADGEIIRIRKSGGYGGGDPCNTEYNTLVVKHYYLKQDGSIGKVFIFYGHLKDIAYFIHLPKEAKDKELKVNIPIKKGEKIAKLNNPTCAGFKNHHLHLTVMPDKLPNDYFDGYNDKQEKNGRARPFTWSKDWVDSKGEQNIPKNDEVFFDNYKPVSLTSLLQNKISDEWQLDTFNDWKKRECISIGITPESRPDFPFSGDGDFNNDGAFDIAIGARKISTMARFEITKLNLEIIKLHFLITAEKAPNIITNLKSIENQKVIGEKKFIDILKTTIGEEQTVKYKAIIIRSASDRNNSNIFVLWGPSFNTYSIVSASDPFAIVQAGKVNMLTDKGLESTTIIKADGIEIGGCELTTTLHYWNGKEFNYFWTSD